MTDPAPEPRPIRLTEQEMRDITGAKQPSKMIEWFRSNGFVIRVDLGSYPIVSRHHWEEMMGLRKPKGRQRAELNVDWLRDWVKARDEKKK